MKQAKSLAGRLRTNNEGNPAQIKRAYELCFGRPPTKPERNAATAFAQKTDLVTLCQSLLATAEFRNLD